MSSDPRGAEQANVAPKLADLPPRFWVLIVLTGIGAGLGAMAMMGVLRAVQHLAFDYHSGEYSTAVAHHSDLRLVVVLAVGGLVTGVGLWIMRRFAGGTGGEPTEVVWTRTGNLSLVRTLLTGALSELSVAMGCSIGREAAPQRTGAAAGAFLAKHFSLPPEQRRLLILKQAIPTTRPASPSDPARRGPDAGFGALKDPRKSHLDRRSGRTSVLRGVWSASGGR